MRWAAWLSFLGALAVWLWIAGLQLHHAYAGAIACHPASSAACQNLINTFQSTNVILKGGFVLQPVPALIGAFVGPLVLAREFETGTFRYAWTQGFGRWRWTLAKLVTLGVAVAALAGAFSVLVVLVLPALRRRAERPQRFRGDPALSRAVRPPPGRVRRVDARRLRDRRPRRHAHPPGRPRHRRHPRRLCRLALLAANVLRQHYLTPLVAKNSNIPGAAWVTSEWWTKGGKVAFGADPLSACSRSSALHRSLHLATAASPLRAPLAQRSVSSSTATREWADYQPASHFWPFQWIEGGWLLALSVLLMAVTVWLVRRRAA